eukprot:TRINITY_DN7474_c0_g1_i5.p1 TRINITY_DN7474_c0_g1~~TRINITY_DN7474_c0_g1_i5.p1  ORF type:complete len:356 (+),score=60.94 TRINITY_DN7474_c0_g1_i5:452-1519(+)
MPASTATAQCRWYNHSAQQWSASGCITLADNITLHSGQREVQCACEHLTEFAILMLRFPNQYDQCGNVIPTIQAALDLLRRLHTILLVIYAVLCLLGLIQAGRISYYTKCAASQVLVGHWLVVVIALFRLANSVTRSEYGDPDVDTKKGVVIMLELIPFALPFLLFSMLALSWMSIHHFSMKDVGANPFKNVKKPFVAVNIVNLLVDVVLFLLLGLMSDDNARLQVVQAGSATMAIISLICAIGFLTYGYLLISTLKQGAAGQSSDVIRRLLPIMVATSAYGLCFIGKSVLKLFSAFATSTFYDNIFAVTLLDYILNGLKLVHLKLKYLPKSKWLCPNSMKWPCLSMRASEIESQ